MATTEKLNPDVSASCAETTRTQCSKAISTLRGIHSQPSIEDMTLQLINDAGALLQENFALSDQNPGMQTGQMPAEGISIKNYTKQAK